MTGPEAVLRRQTVGHRTGPRGAVADAMREPRDCLV